MPTGKEKLPVASTRSAKPTVMMPNPGGSWADPNLEPNNRIFFKEMRRRDFYIRDNAWRIMTSVGTVLLRRDLKGSRVHYKKPFYLCTVEMNLETRNSPRHKMGSHNNLRLFIFKK